MVMHIPLPNAQLRHYMEFNHCTWLILITACTEHFLLMVGWWRMIQPTLSLFEVPLLAWIASLSQTFVPPCEPLIYSSNLVLLLRPRHPSISWHGDGVHLRNQHPFHSDLVFVLNGSYNMHTQRISGSPSGQLQCREQSDRMHKSALFVLRSFQLHNKVFWFSLSEASFSDTRSMTSELALEDVHVRLCEGPGDPEAGVGESLTLSSSPSVGYIV
ncbi:hypothetical protein BT96DRAFT_437787 [Gymnopus androsaceus JB14]|uniref:Uncharacterized protein n=1 Tax=Gymnopus androsaceus JB14 TaxID=1447944 RepID=A0A6A4GSB2_9AGAR|nr:hypothetical protein BT96DRAFT_437787 [Gymnopus androsaceus JB14]